MKKSLSLLTALVGLLFAGQVVHMSAEEALDISDSVVLAEITSTITFHMDFGNKEEYIFRAIDALTESESLEGRVFADYYYAYPLVWTDEEGNEVWGSPIVSGSGYEMSAEQGDTVIVFLGYIPTTPESHIEVIRIEPYSNLEMIEELIKESENIPLESVNPN